MWQLSCNNSLNHCNGDYMAYKAKNIYYPDLCRKSLQWFFQWLCCYCDFYSDRVFLFCLFLIWSWGRLLLRVSISQDSYSVCEPWLGMEVRGVTFKEREIEDPWVYVFIKVCGHSPLGLPLTWQGYDLTNLKKTDWNREDLLKDSGVDC
jgi:hypothetical protein